MEARRYSELPRQVRLEDIGLPARDIDKGVANLVRGLLSIRVPTRSSCEGHLDDNHHQHPWVGFNGFSFAKIAALRYLVGKWNEDNGNEIKWEVEVNRLSPKMEDHCRSCFPDKQLNIPQEQIERLQQSADQLGHFIFHSREDPEIRELVAVDDF